MTGCIKYTFDLVAKLSGYNWVTAGQGISGIPSGEL